MPIEKVEGGYRWGEHGHVYPNREGAEKQAAAAHAHGFEGDATEGQLGERIAREINRGHEPKQAEAIAYSELGEPKKDEALDPWKKLAGPAPAPAGAGGAFPFATSGYDSNRLPQQVTIADMKARYGK